MEMHTEKTAGTLRAIQEDIACGCWFTAGGATLPRIIRGINDQGEICTVRVLEVVRSEEKRYAGIETVEHVCRIALEDRIEIVKLIFYKLECRWKIVFS